MDTVWRSWLKAISWRALATLVTMVVAFLWTGQLALALGIGGLDTLAKLALYVVHERAWARVSLGVRRIAPRGEMAA